MRKKNWEMREKRWRKRGFDKVFYLESKENVIWRECEKIGNELDGSINGELRVEWNDRLDKGRVGIGREWDERWWEKEEKEKEDMDLKGGKDERRIGIDWGWKKKDIKWIVRIKKKGKVIGWKRMKNGIGWGLENIVIERDEEKRRVEGKKKLKEIERIKKIDEIIRIDRRYGDEG